MTHEEFETIAALDAAGAASSEETAALEAHIRDCETCRHARYEFLEAASLIARDLPPVVPPREVRERLMNEIDPVTEPEESSTWGIDRKWLAAAAMLFFALWLWRELGMHVTKEHLSSQTAEIEALRAQADVFRQQKDKLTAAMAGIATPGTRAIDLVGQQVSPTAAAKVFVEPGQHRAVVLFTNLPRNAKDKSYELWIIRGDQPKPQNAGVFDASGEGRATLVIENLPVETEIKALAVTLEPKGGVEEPTNSNFYVMGKT